LVDSRDLLGEGPVWDARAGRLYWFDIKGRQIKWFDPATGGADHRDLPLRASAGAPKASGGLILATEQGLCDFDPETGALATRLACAAPPGFRSNEGKIDAAGRFWWSMMDDDEGKRPGFIERYDASGVSSRMIEGVHIANTLTSSADGRTLYWADSAERTLYASDIDPATGALGERRVVAHTRDGAGTPDGSAVDADGFLWNCQWGAWRIVRYAPDGRIDRVVATPVAQPTSCAFGGPGLRTLFVTSARNGLSADALAGQPLAGALFAFEPGVAGAPLPVFPA
jgi:sugar lactone lactonase YvrE